MDEKEPLKEGEPLPENNNLYRLVLFTQRDKNNDALPATRCFKLQPADENKLSCDFEPMTTVSKTIARAGATYKFGKEEFKNHKDWDVYALEIDFVRKIQNVIDVIYNPITFNPKQKGKPDNDSHSLIKFSPIPEADEPEILVLLRNHAAERIMPKDEDEIESLVQEYRRQWD